MMYRMVMYDSIAEFNRWSEDMSSTGWKIMDFRLSPSPNPKIVNGVLVMWWKGQ